MRAISIQLLILIVLLVARRAQADAPTPEIPADLILERFTISKAGDGMLAPVRVAEKDYLFLVDTGPSGTCFDTSIPLGQPVDVVTAHGSQGSVQLKLYDPPEASVGRIPLGAMNKVSGMDFSSFRRVIGQDIYGVIGMDFLGKYVVHINIEKGVLLLLKSTPSKAGIELPISWEPGGYPSIAGRVGPGETVRFIIDTGAVVYETGRLGMFETRSRLRRGQLSEIGNRLEVSISGTESVPFFQASSMSISEFTVDSPIFGESRGETPNLLALSFWSRFAATFDFPQRKVYLRKSAFYGRRDRWNVTGLHLWRNRGSIEVCAVDTGSPAARAGLKKGDVLVELNGFSSSKTSLFELRGILRDGGQLTCVVRRDSKNLRLIISQPRQGQ